MHGSTSAEKLLRPDASRPECDQPSTAAADSEAFATQPTRRLAAIEPDASALPRNSHPRPEPSSVERALRLLGVRARAANDVSPSATRNTQAADGGDAAAVPNGRATETQPPWAEVVTLLRSLHDLVLGLRTSTNRAAGRKPRQEKIGSLVSLSEAARRLGISRNDTLHQMIRDKRLKAVLVNGRYKVPVAELERVAAEGLPRPGRNGR